MKTFLWLLLTFIFGIFTNIIGITFRDPNFYYLLLFLVAAYLIGGIKNN